MGKSWLFAEGVRGALNGWAADVEVAAGGLCEEEGSPCRGADCVAWFGESVAAVLVLDERFLLDSCDTALLNSGVSLL